MVETNPTDNPPLILAIETATRAGSVALARGTGALSSRIGDPSISHSANLITMIQQVLDEAGSKLAEVDLFAASSGPGSFTGLRIGLATVKALAKCSAQKVVGVSTLAAIAYASGAKGEVVALLPAGRGEVFAQMFFVEQGSVEPRDRAAHLSPPALLETYGKSPNLTWVGEGALQQFQSLTEWGANHSLNWTITKEAENNLAPAIAALATVDFRAGKAANAEELRACYVRPSDAEINERWPQEKAQP